MIFMFSLYEMQHVMESRKMELNQHLVNKSYARQAGLIKDHVSLLEQIKRIINVRTKSRQAECCA